MGLTATSFATVSFFPLSKCSRLPSEVCREFDALAVARLTVDIPMGSAVDEAY